MYSKTFLISVNTASILCLFGLLLGCSSPSQPNSDLFTTKAFVSGQITSPDGNTIGDATITFNQLGFNSCDQTSFEYDTIKSDVNGQYSIEIKSLNYGGEICLNAYALPPEGSNYRSSDTLQFTVLVSKDPPFDSTEVDFALNN